MKKGAYILAGLFAAFLCYGPVGRMFLDSLSALGPVTREIFGSTVTLLKLWHTFVLAGLTTALALVVGVGFALSVTSGSVPGAPLFRVLGVAPLMIPPIVGAMAWSDTRDPATVSGAAHWVVLFGQAVFNAMGGLQSLLGTVLILTFCLFPFVSILSVRALESVDARLFDSARIARGEGRARLLLLRMIAPDALAGALFVFVFSASEFGVPEYLSVLGGGKRWYSYPEEIFRRWDILGRQGEAASASAVAASWPLIAFTALALVLLLRFRAKGTSETVTADQESLVGRKGYLPRGKARLFGAAGLFWAGGTLLLGLAYPLASMLTWTHGLSTFAKAWDQGGGDLIYSLECAAGAGLVTALLALPLGHLAARSRRGRLVEALALLPLSVPGVLLGIGIIRLWNDTPGPVGDLLAWVYGTPLMLVLAYTARFLPLAVLSLAAWFRRVPGQMEEAALLAGAGPLRRFLKVHLPMALPAGFAGAILTFVLSLRELDLAARVPAGNPTAINRIANVVHFGGQDVGAALFILLFLCSASLPLLYWTVTGKRPEVA